MHSPFQQQLMDHAVRVIALARPLVAAIARRDRDLGSQIRCALNSVSLNLAEGLGSRAGNARLRFESALGSLYEARAGLRAGVAWGFVSAQECTEALEVSDRLAARLYGLSRP
jgi:four helix bundle protein